MAGKVGPKKLAYVSAEISLDEIDIPLCSFSISGFVEAFWIDDSIESIEDITVKSAPCDWGDFAENAVVEELLSDVVHQKLVHPETGKVIWKGIYQIMLVCSEQFELDSFPVDRQLANVITSFNVEEYKFLRMRPEWIHEDWSDHDPTCCLKTRLGDKCAGLYTMAEPIMDINEENVMWRLCISRKVNFYLISLVLPTLLILMCNVPVLSIAVSDVADRLAWTGAMFLCIIAFQYVAQALLPAGGGITLMGTYLMMGLAASGLAVFENGAAAWLIDYDDEENGEDLAIIVDFWFFVSYAIFWIIVHGYIVYAIRNNVFGQSWEQIFNDDTPPEPFHPDDVGFTPHAFLNNGKISFVEPKAKSE